MIHDPHTLARTTDPVTSHEAAEQVDPNRSQAAVLKFADQYLARFFTDKGLVVTYQRVRETAGFPELSDSRIRTARRELVEAHRIAFAGYTTPAKGRRESIWEVL